MNYAISVRIPVVRAYPSEVQLPGKLYINISVCAPRHYNIGEWITVPGTDVQGEVMGSAHTNRLADSFRYSF